MQLFDVKDQAKNEVLKNFITSAFPPEQAKALCADIFGSEDSKITRSHELEQLLQMTSNLCVFNLKIGLTLA